MGELLPRLFRLILTTSIASDVTPELARVGRRFSSGPELAVVGFVEPLSRLLANVLKQGRGLARTILAHGEAASIQPLEGFG